MSVRHAILGLLLQSPSHPYGVAARFDQQIGPAWDVNRGQVYQAISSLERDGLIEPVDPSGSGGGGSAAGPSYRTTASGAAEYERWFASPSARARPLRDGLFVKLGLSSPDDLDAVIAS